MYSLRTLKGLSEFKDIDLKNTKNKTFLRQKRCLNQCYLVT